MESASQPSAPHLNFDVASKSTYNWTINDAGTASDIARYLNKATAMSTSAWVAPICPYCRKYLETETFEVFSEDDEHDEDDPFRQRELSYFLKSCPYCAFWAFCGTSIGNRCMDPNYAVLASSVAAKFSESLPEGCGEELATHLRRHPESWHDLPPTRMETLVAEIFHANYRDCEVLHVGRPGDRGIDVLFIDCGGIRWLLQVKRRAIPNKAEGFSTLQSILGTLVLEGERHGMVVSTADYFSYQARKAQRDARDHGYIVNLLDKGVLNRMIGAMLPRTPWRGLFAHPSVDHIGDEIRHHFLRSQIDAQLSFFIDK